MRKERDHRLKLQLMEAALCLQSESSPTDMILGSLALVRSALTSIQEVPRKDSGKLQKQRSTVIKRSRNPIFNEDFFFDGISKDDLHRRSIKIKAVNKASTMKRDYILEAVLTTTPYPGLMLQCDQTMGLFNVTGIGMLLL
ncbi:C2 calcium-dependent domain-containing protein 4C [Chelonia mydas]|uniref:C2 calcium-dependent domain-containing protein 4C n=1 Tax=Chelonia mydas TaxID=8469 RepID=M7B495_CHEMY|nr:C2 calcium-dependent domain-containing protein 4C [Chelonia mydas]